MTNESPKIAKPEELDYQLAYRAHANTSHVPEDRARQAQQGYADDVNGFYAEMFKHAVTDQQKTLLAEEMERYRQGYLQHYGAYLASHSRVASSMITGPANFPVAQQRKRGQAADNKRDEFLEWRDRARKAIERKVLDARPEEAKQDARWQELARDIRGSLAEIRAIDEQGSPFTRTSFVNSIAGKVERLADQGEVALVEKALGLVREYNGSHKKPAISERHGIWQLGELAKQKAQQHDAALDKEPEVLAEKEGVRIVANHQADRVQIVFAARPSVEMIGKLKGEAWNWSRTEGAWQRKLTEAAKASAKRIVGL
jgi:hypothetical protein